LDYAHRRNVVHRDIKPSNVLYGEAGQIQVVDFGIAKIESSTLTMTGAILGTPGYMAPEQCQGTPSDHRADIFAAGVILYELLTGERPFRASTGIATLQQALSLEPIKPSQLNVQCTPALDAIVARAMAKRREERYQSAREFIAALKQLAHAARSSIAVAASIPTIAGTVLDAAAQGKTTKRKGVLVTAGSVALVALAVISFSVGKERVAPEPDPPLIEKIGLPPEPAEALTPKPPPRGHDNAGAVESATMDSLDLRLAEIVEHIECAELKPSVTPSREVVLAGYLKPEDRKRVEQELARLPGVTSVLFQAETLAWPYCELRGLLGPYESANGTRRNQFGEPAGVRLASDRPEARYQEGERLVLTLTAPDRDSFLYVDYFLLDGSVVHLFPLTASQRKPQRAGAGITLGQAGGGSTREWQVSSPFGSEMLVAVAAQEPLFAAPRPEMDTSKDYLPLLAQALQQARSKDAMVLADLLPITTSAAAEAHSAAAPSRP